MSNLRKHTRRMVHFPAKIDVGAAAPMRDCMLMDVSSTGARLTAEQPAQLPADFTVVLSYRGVPRRRCHVVWRSCEEIGVRFEDETAIKKRKVREAPAVTADGAVTADKSAETAE
jgi:hypothetical protein